jgi:hypothetical protein
VVPRSRFRPNPGTPFGYATMLVRARIDRARALSASGDAGASVIEWVIITALLLAIALAVGVTLRATITKKASDIKLDTPP